MIRSKLIYFLIVMAGFFGACGQDYNSNSGDEGLGGGKPPAAGDCSDAAGARLCAAVQVIQSRCFGCHFAWKNYKNDQDWTKSGLISAGKSAESKIIKRLVNNGGDMPLGGSAIPESEHETIKTWINGL